MFRKTVSPIMMFLLILGIVALTFKIQMVRAYDGNITINADGSITPSTAPIQRNGDTYILTGNINITRALNTNGFDIERDNIVLNGAGYTVTGSPNRNGITLDSMENVTVGNMTITNFGTGISLSSSSDCTVSGNNVTNNDYGIDLDSSSNNVLSGNNVTASNDYGIWLDYSSNSTLSGNSVTASINPGILLESSSGNTLSENNVTANYLDGIVLTSSNNNTLSGNDVIANNAWGISLFSSANNTIYDNNFINNTYAQVGSSDPTDVWDNGSVGNYWSDYLTKYPNAAQVDSSGVWNTPYVIGPNIADHYPLMTPWAPLSASITPLSASISIGQSLTFNSTITGGSSPYNYQWYLNDSAVSGATSTSWTFMPATIGTYNIYLNVTDSANSTAQSDTAYITAGLCNITFDGTGVGSDFTGAVVTIDGINYAASDLPVSFWWDNGSTHTFAFQSPLIVEANAEQYAWIGTTGLSSEQSGSINVITDGSIVGNYKTQYNVTIIQTGVGSDFTGTVVTIDGTNYNVSELPVTFQWDEGSIHSFSFASLLNVNASRGYCWWSTSGLSSLKNDTLTVTASGNVTATYGLIGDISHEGSVSLKDLVMFATAYGSRPGDSNWNPECDVAAQGRINLADLVTLATHYGQHNP